MLDIPGFEGRYAATTDGQIWSHPKTWRRGRMTITLDGAFIKPVKDHDGYLRVTLCKDTKHRINRMVHRLVALTYLPNPNHLPAINHRNGNKADNRLDNLEWCSNKENSTHAVRTGLIKRQKSAPRAKLSNDTAAEIRSRFAKGNITQNNLAKLFGVSRKTIRDVISGVSWTDHQQDQLPPSGG